MQDAARRLFDLTKSKDPDSIEGENGTEVAKVTVSVDETWLKNESIKRI